jgi:hypothetical protein
MVDSKALFRYTGHLIWKRGKESMKQANQGIESTGEALYVDALQSMQNILLRRGFEVVVEGHKLRFFGGDREAILELNKVLDSQVSEANPLGTVLGTPLATLLNEMGLDVDVESGPDGECVIAYPQV